MYRYAAIGNNTTRVALHIERIYLMTSPWHSSHPTAHEAYREPGFSYLASWKTRMEGSNIDAGLRQVQEASTDATELETTSSCKPGTESAHTHRPGRQNGAGQPGR